MLIRLLNKSVYRRVPLFHLHVITSHHAIIIIVVIVICTVSSIPENIKWQNCRYVPALGTAQGSCSITLQVGETCVTSAVEDKW